MRFCNAVLLISLLAMAGAACSGDDGASAPEITTTTATDTADTADTTDTAAPPTDGIAYEVFSSDEGAGCGVFVSVPADAVDDATDARAMLWAGVVAQDFTTCGFSDVVEAGLITVNGLDDYNQPDWSTVEEHAFFGVSGWDELVADCHEAVLTDECAAALEASLTE